MMPVITEMYRAAKPQDIVAAAARANMEVQSVDCNNEIGREGAMWRNMREIRSGHQGTKGKEDGGGP
jgi:hypothetical protein